MIPNQATRLVSLFLALTLFLPNPALALRTETPTQSGVEEEVGTALQAGLEETVLNKFLKEMKQNQTWAPLLEKLSSDQKQSLLNFSKAEETETALTDWFGEAWTGIPAEKKARQLSFLARARSRTQNYARKEAEQAARRQATLAADQAYLAKGVEEAIEQQTRQMFFFGPRKHDAYALTEQMIRNSGYAGLRYVPFQRMPEVPDRLFERLGLQKGRRLLEVGPGPIGGIGLLAALRGMDVVMVETDQPFQVDLQKLQAELQKAGVQLELIRRAAERMGTRMVHPLEKLRQHVANHRHLIQAAAGSIEIIPGDFSKPEIQELAGKRGPFHAIVATDVVNPAGGEFAQTQALTTTGEPIEAAAILEGLATLASGARVEALYVSFLGPEVGGGTGPLVTGTYAQFDSALQQKGLSPLYESAPLPNSGGILRARIYRPTGLIPTGPRLEELAEEVPPAAGLEELPTSLPAPSISASLLAVADPQEFAARAVAARRAGAERVHFDVSEETLTLFTPARLKEIKESGRHAKPEIPVDVHLVLPEPSEAMILEYLKAGADSVSVHWEGFRNRADLVARLQLIHQYPAKAVLAVSPDANIDEIGMFLNAAGEIVDMVSLSGVTPGMGGQSFQLRVLGSPRRLRSHYHYAGLIQMDGGIEPKFSAPLSREAGADILVAGTAFFGKPSERRNYQALRSAYEALRGFVPISKIEMVQRCLKCGAQFPPFQEMAICPNCRGDYLEFVASDSVDFMNKILPQRPGMWRYEALLPVPPAQIVTAGEGGTPIVHLEDLSQQLGINLYVKVEATNPTGTFKDREASFVVSRAKAAGQDNLVLQSTGNTALSMSYYAGLAGLRSYAFIPARSAYKLIGPLRSRGNKIILVEGEPVDVKSYATQFATAHGFPKVSSFHERSEANTTQAYEIGEAILAGELPNPDFYVQTIAAGMGPIGFYIGMERLVRWTDGRVTLPKVVGVQISEFAPVHSAWETDLDEVGPEGRTPTYGVEQPFEPTLHTTNAPAYYPHLRAALKASQGSLTKVEPDEVRVLVPELRKSLARHGYTLSETEQSSFIGYTGLVKEVRGGLIPAGSTVLLMITGKGSRPHFERVEPDAVILPEYDPKRLFQQLEAGETVRASSEARAYQAARAIAEYEGWAMGKVMEAIYLGRMTKALSERRWSSQEEAMVRGTRRFLISGTMGVSGPLGQIMRSTAARYLNQKYANVGFEIIPIEDVSGVTSGEGAFYFLPEEQLRDSIHNAAGARLGVLLTDVGGTKTAVMVSEVDRDGRLINPAHPSVIREVSTLTWTSRDLMFDEIARAMKQVVAEAQAKGIEVLPLAGVAFAAAFVKPGGGIMYQGTDNPIAVGSGFDLAPNMPGTFPSKELAQRVPGFTIHVVNDGVAQFRYLVDTAMRAPDIRKKLLGEKVVSVAPGTGLGTGFGSVDVDGNLVLFPMTHISDLVVKDFQGGLTLLLEPDGERMEVKVPTPGPRRWAKDFLSGRAVEHIATAIDRTLLEAGRKPIFLPQVAGYAQMKQEEVAAALDPSNRKTPVTAKLVNTILEKARSADLSISPAAGLEEDLADLFNKLRRQKRLVPTSYVSHLHRDRTGSTHSTVRIDFANKRLRLPPYFRFDQGAMSVYRDKGGVYLVLKDSQNPRNLFVLQRRSSGHERGLFSVASGERIASAQKRSAYLGRSNDFRAFFYRLNRKTVQTRQRIIGIGRMQFLIGSHRGLQVRKPPTLVHHLEGARTNARQILEGEKVLLTLRRRAIDQVEIIYGDEDQEPSFVAVGERSKIPRFFNLWEIIKELDQAGIIAAPQTLRPFLPSSRLVYSPYGVAEYRVNTTSTPPLIRRAEDVVGAKKDSWPFLELAKTSLAPAAGLESRRATNKKAVLGEASRDGEAGTVTRPEGGRGPEVGLAAASGRGVLGVEPSGRDSPTREPQAEVSQWPDNRTKYPPSRALLPVLTKPESHSQYGHVQSNPHSEYFGAERLLPNKGPQDQSSQRDGPRIRQEANQRSSLPSRELFHPSPVYHQIPHAAGLEEDGHKKAVAAMAQEINALVRKFGLVASPLPSPPPGTYLASKIFRSDKTREWELLVRVFYAKGENNPFRVAVERYYPETDEWRAIARWGTDRPEYVLPMLNRALKDDAVVRALSELAGGPPAGLGEGWKTLDSVMLDIFTQMGHLAGEGIGVVETSVALQPTAYKGDLAPGVKIQIREGSSKPLQGSSRTDLDGIVAFMEFVSELSKSLAGQTLVRIQVNLPGLKNEIRVPEAVQGKVEYDSKAQTLKVTLRRKPIAAGLEEVERFKPEEFIGRYPEQAEAARKVSGATGFIVMPEDFTVRIHRHPTLASGLEEFVNAELKKLPPNFVRVLLQEIPPSADQVRPPAVAVLDALLPEPPYSLIVPKIRHYNGQPFEHSLPKLVAIAVLNRLDAATVQILAVWEFESRGRRYRVLAVQA